MRNSKDIIKTRCETILSTTLELIKDKTPEQARSYVTRELNTNTIKDSTQDEFAQYLESLQTEPQQEEDTQTSTTKTHALAIAIALADANTLKILLGAFDKQHINSKATQVWASVHQQLYTLMHLALDPRSNINLLRTLAKDEPELLCQKLSSIIQLLAAKGANPNLIPDGNNRQPAMAAGNASGYLSLIHI